MANPLRSSSRNFPAPYDYPPSPAQPQPHPQSQPLPPASHPPQPPTQPLAPPSQSLPASTAPMYAQQLPLSSATAASASPYPPSPSYTPASAPYPSYPPSSSPAFPNTPQPSLQHFHSHPPPAPPQQQLHPSASQLHQPLQQPPSYHPYHPHHPNLPHHPHHPHLQHPPSPYDPSVGPIPSLIPQPMSPSHLPPQISHPPTNYPPGQPSLIHNPSHGPSIPHFNSSSQTPTRQTAEVKLEISCENLRDRDFASKSDPTCVVFLEEKFAPHGYPVVPGYADPSFDTEQSQIRWREHSRTEYIRNNLNPHFNVQISVPYHFEEIQHIRFGLWDIDSSRADLKNHDFLGSVSTTIAELVTRGTWTARLTSPNVRDTRRMFGGIRDLGTITIIVHEERQQSQLLIKASMQGYKLDKKDILSSDPFFVLTQVGGSSAGSRTRLYRSETIKKNTSPVWKPFQAKVAMPKGGGTDKVMLEFVVFDEDRYRRNDEIGKAVTPIADLETGSTLEVIKEKRRRRRWYKNSGILEITKFRALRMPSLVDYLQGGLKLHFSVAVDLTISNGIPSDPLSLHFRQEVYGNHYIRALTAVAQILRVYTSSDNLFAAFGFGAELPGTPGVTSSCFPLGLGADPHCYGIEGVLNAYGTALSSVKLSGPTNFSPLISIVTQTAMQRPNTQTDQNYDVLLILTDGVVSDFQPTVERIIQASKCAPLSIIIIGIGNKDFRKMKVLDSDDEPLRALEGSQAERDICQFVAFREFEHAPPEKLAAAVLAELPGNIVEYFIGACEPPITPGQRPIMPTMT